MKMFKLRLYNIESPRALPTVWLCDECLCASGIAGAILRIEFDATIYCENCGTIGNKEKKNEA